MVLKEDSDPGLLIKSVGVLYCPLSPIEGERKYEQIADEEALQIANAIHLALTDHGIATEIVEFDPLKISYLNKFDWTFNLTETVYGFPYLDYQIAQLLENNQIHFTGAGSKSLEVSLQKGKAKEIMTCHQMITPDYRITSEGMPIQIPKKPFPYIVKPIHEDGSIGITNQSIVHNQNELDQQVRKIHALYHEDALVEEYVTGRDISVSIIGSDLNRTVLPLSECVYLNPAENQILTYDSKWLVNSPDYRNTEVFCPIELDPEMAQELERIAILAFEVMECKDYARIDFRVKGCTPYLLDVNPNPSIHPDDAGFTRSWKATGRNYDQLVMEILTSSIENSGIHQKVNTYENPNSQN